MKIVVTSFALLSLLSPLHQVAAAECGGAASGEDSKDTRFSDLGISSYEPLYFIVGGNDGFNAKFQLSFKYQLFREKGWFSQCLRAPTHLYLSYSQTSLWDLDERSSPFKDSSYRPRVFYLKESAWESSGKRWRADFEAGFAHESNGKADPDSRSINAGYIKPTLSYYVGDKRRFYVAPLVYSYIDIAENPNIADYRGHVDLLIGYGSGNRGSATTDYDWNAWTVLRKGDKSDYGSIEVNLATPFRFLTGNRMNGWLLMQYFSGYGESLLDYDRKLRAQFRAGFAILVQ